MCVERVVVGLHGAYQELAADLAAVEPRLRAERMRMLASLGLAMLRVRTQVPQPVAEVAPEAASGLSGRKSRLLDRLG